MKTQILKKSIIVVSILFSMSFFAQNFVENTLNLEQKTQTQIFSLSPISKKVHQVNGVVFGAGHFDSQKIKNQTINGINVEVNPTVLLFPIFFIAGERIYKETLLDKPISDTLVQPFNTNLKIKINGLNISSGCFMSDIDFSGVNISTFNIYNRCQGVNIAPIGSIAQEMNGISVSILNTFNTCRGVSIGLINRSNTLKGVQIGIYNENKHQKGLQIGFWNTNDKRSMPFINW